jgi:hypothetical protein
MAGCHRLGWMAARGRLQFLVHCQLGDRARYWGGGSAGYRRVAGCRRGQPPHR